MPAGLNAAKGDNRFSHYSNVQYFSLHIVEVLYLGRDKFAIFTITVYVNIIVNMYLYIDARAQVFSAL